MRGEKKMVRLHTCETAGSPPRARGKDVIISLTVCGGRITPACAGKSVRAGGVASMLADHPRVRGEKLLIDGGIEP